MQRPDKFAGARKVSVLRSGDFQRIRHFRIVVRGIALRTLAANILRHVGVELAGILNRSQIAEHQPGSRIDFPFNAGAVIGIDALKI